MASKAGKAFQGVRRELWQRIRAVDAEHTGHRVASNGEETAAFLLSL